MTTYYWRPDTADVGGSPSDLDLSQPWEPFRDIYVGYHDPDYDSGGFVSGVPRIARENRPALIFDHGEESDDYERRAAVIDAIGGESIGDVTDAEIWMRFLPVGAGGDSRAVFRQRGVGADNATGYVGGLRRGVDRTSITRYNDGRGEYIATTSDVSGGYEYWQQRIRVEGDDIYVKVWRDIEAEPTDWTLVTSDSAVSGPGALGFFQFDTGWNDDHADNANNPHHTHIYEWGVGTDGDRAPTGPINRREIIDETRINAIAAGPFGTWLAAGRGDGHIDIYDADTHTLIDFILEGDRHGAVAASCERTAASSPNADWLAVSLEEPRVTRVFETDDWSEVASFSNGGYGVAWNTDSSLLAVGGQSNISVYTVGDWTEHATRDPGTDVTSVDFASNTTDELAFVTDNGTLEYCDDTLTTLESATTDPDASCVDISGGDDMVAVGSWSNSVGVYDPTNGLAELYYDSPDDDTSEQFRGSVYTVTFEPTRGWLVYANGAGGNGMIRVVDTDDWSYVDEHYASDDVESVAFYRNGLRAAVGDRSRFEALDVSGDGYRGIDLPGGVAEHLEVKRSEWDSPRDVEAIYVNSADGEGEKLVWRRD